MKKCFFSILTMLILILGMPVLVFADPHDPPGCIIPTSLPIEWPVVCPSDPCPESDDVQP